MLRKSSHAEALARARSERLEEEEKRRSRKKKRYNSHFTDDRTEVQRFQMRKM